MFPVDGVYQIDEKALRSGLGVRRWSENLSSTIAAVQVTFAASRCPIDKVRVITRWTYTSLAGAAQTLAAITPVLFTIESATAGDNIYSEALDDGAGQLYFAESFNVHIPLMPAELVRFTANYTAGVNANTLAVSLVGYEIPRGNFQF